MAANQRFSCPIQISSDDIDELGHVNNVVYVRWIQEVAAAHWDTVASDQLKSQFKWVVLRHEVDYKNPAYLNDQIIGTTWVGQHHGARFERYVKLTTADGNKTFAEAKTMWCMIDAFTGKPTRIGDGVLAIL